MVNATTQVLPFQDVPSASAPLPAMPAPPLGLPAATTPPAPPPRGPAPAPPTQQLPIIPVGFMTNMDTAAMAYGQAKTVPDERIDMARWAHSMDFEDDKQGWLEWSVNFFFIILFFTENVLIYFTFATVPAFHGRLYNIVDLHLILLPALRIALLSFAALGTATLAAMIVVVDCLKKPLFHELMNFMLFFSALPCGIMSGIILYYSERTQLAPFIAVVFVLFTIFIWCLHMRFRYNQSLNVVSRISLDVSWFVALACGVLLLAIYLSDQLHTITKSDVLGCPYAANKRMPVHVPILGKWYCASWDEEQGMNILRAPVSNVPVRLACSDSFVLAFSVSIEPHVVECPPGCFTSQAYSTGNVQSSVVGCGVYAADSSICMAAMHAGVLTDDGGQTVVYGRLGAASFDSCSRNSITSQARFVVHQGSVSVSQPGRSESSTYSLPSGARRLLTTPAVLGPGQQQVPQAFHFDNMPDSRDFLWLKSYDTLLASEDAVEDSKPWTRIEATVSARLAGIELADAKIQLGPAAHQELFVQPRHGHVIGSTPAQCQIRNSGVLCNEASSAVLELDFCSKELKECLDQ